MVLPVRLHAYTYADYVALEAHSTVRHEFVAGEIYAMAGGTPEHAALAAAMLHLLQRELPSTCRAYTSDLRVRISAGDLSTYPDATVICGKTERALEDTLAVVNPKVLAEVTSDSTETYDRGTKLEEYQRLASLSEVLIVSHREPRIDVVTRDQEGWRTTVFRAGQRVELPSLGVGFEVDELYERAHRGD